MLAAHARLRRRGDFVAALRQGRRAGGGRPALLVIHLASDPEHPDEEARVGFVVSRSVGHAVVRNRVRRRLQHLAAARLDALPPGARLVVRALPSAARASSAELGAALDVALSRALTAQPR